MDHIDLSREENYLEPNEAGDSVEVDQHAHSPKGKKKEVKDLMFGIILNYMMKRQSVFTVGNFINMATKMRGLVHCETILSAYVRNIHIGL